MGESHVEIALNNLNIQQQVAAAVTTAFPGDRQSVLHMLIPDDTYDKLRAVRGMVETGAIKHYEIVPGVDLFVDFSSAPIPSFEPEAVQIQTNRVGPLMTFLNELQAVHERYEEVRGVLKWLNRHATPGAIRYYWPAAMKLVSTSPIWADLSEVPSRYSIPDLISEWSQNLKDSASTVTGMLLLPSDVYARKREKMWVTMKPKRVHVGERSGYTTDTITYNI